MVTDHCFITIQRLLELLGTYSHWRHYLSLGDAVLVLVDRTRLMVLVDCTPQFVPPKLLAICKFWATVIQFTRTQV